MLEMRMVSNIEDILGQLTDLETTQVPFALELGLNRTAAEGQDAVRRKMDDRFTLRREWVRRGIRISKSTKTNLHAHVYTLDWFMEEQEAGGVRTPRKAPTLFIPTLAIRKGGTIRGTPAKRNLPQTLMKQAQAPRAARKKYRKDGGYAYRKPKAFFLPESNRAGVPGGIWIRRYADKRLPIVLLYRTVDRAKIPARWGFGATVQGVSDKRLRANFVKALDEALKTAKNGARRSLYVEHLVEHDGMTGRISPTERALVTARHDRLHSGGMGAVLGGNAP